MRIARIWPELIYVFGVSVIDWAEVVGDVSPATTRLFLQKIWRRCRIKLKKVKDIVRQMMSVKEMLSHLKIEQKYGFLSFSLG